MSGPTIRIGGFDSLPDVSIMPDFGGNTIEINNMNDFDLGLLGNQRKLIGTPPRGQSPAPRLGGFGDLVESDGIDFVNLEDTGVTFNVRPPPSGVGDTIKILRDSSEPMAPRPIGPTLTLNSGPQMSAPSHSVAPSAIPAQTSTWFTGAPTHPVAPAPASGGFASGLRSLFGGGGGGGGGSAVAAAAAGGMDASQMSASSYLTPEQESAKKTDGLTMLERMDRKGVGGTKMTIANSLEEIDAELARRKDSKALEASIRFQRSMLTTVTNGMEFLNSRYDPLGVALDGWSEQVHENVEDYDDIFEELYDKYKDKSKVAPEVRLIMSLGLSAAMCHVTNTMFKSKMPGMDDIMRKNPDLARQMAAAAAEHAVGPGFANFVSMGMPGGGGTNTPRRTQAPAQQQPPSPPPEQMGGMSGFMPSIGSSLNARIPNLDPRGAVDGGAPQATARREMRGPTGVDVNDILRTLNAAGDLPQRSVPGGLESEDHGSVGSGMTTETMRRSGQSRRRKATTSQPTGSTLTLNV